MSDTPLSSQIYLSRDSIREQITNEVKNYMELNNVDLTKSSFLSFIIDTVSTLTGNLLFYQLSTYREFFLTKAQLPESILNLSAFLGYNTTEATPADVNVLMSIPLTFDFGDGSELQFTIPEGFVFKADEIEFRTYYSTTITIASGYSSITIQVAEENKRFTLPYEIEDNNLLFVLPLTQVKEVEQEFQIDSDTQEFQFVTLDVPVEGEVASLIVEIQPPGSAGYTEWTEFDSLFLMSSTDQGYVSRRTDTGRRLTFGNGLIGVQPEGGSNVLVTVQTTEGAEGNVISGSIRSGERIYVQVTDGGVVRNDVVSYEVVNTSAAFGGEDEESLEEIRRNSIASISTLDRLVTENDYKNINVVVPDSPLAQNSLPILKRSDLQVNEIELFSAILYGSGTEEIDNLVPIRNAIFELPVGDTTIQRDEEIQIGESTYYSMFEINVDLLNTVGEYEYVIYELELLPALETSFGSTYDLYCDKLEIIRSGTQGIYRLYYQTSESTADLATASMTISSSGASRTMTNDSTAGYFTYTFPNYNVIPIGEQTYKFTIKDNLGNDIARYSNTFTFRTDLSTFMRSNVVETTDTILDGTSYIVVDSSSIVYDVPVIEKDYYDAIDKRAFELEVYQALVTSMDLDDHKMLTDFTNIKFTNTHGTLEGMMLNEATVDPIIDIVDTLPTSGTNGDRYIYSPCTGNAENQDDIITYQVVVDSTSIVDGTSMIVIDSTSSNILYEEPVIDTIAYIQSKGENYIYSERGWIPLPDYTIPLEIDIEVVRSSTYSGTITALMTTVRETIYDAFKDRFGTNAEFYRSEIIDVVQDIDGVSHCRLRKPETSIFFNFELINFTEDQLLAYGPEYVYFTEDSITVKVT
jgi:hypothetical protein